MGKNVGKVGNICQNEKTTGKRYQWKWHIEIPKYGKDEKWCQNMGEDGKRCQNMQLYACNTMWKKYKKSKKSNKILVGPGTTTSRG